MKITDFYTPEQIEYAVRTGRENEYWREYLDKAPSELCRQLIVYEFCSSEFWDENDGSEKLRDEIVQKFSTEDWQYIASHTANNPWGGKCRAMAKQNGSRRPGTPDHLDFKLVDPVEEGESWTEFYRTCPPMAVAILINGRDLMETVEKTECDQGYLSPGEERPYGHRKPDWLYKDLMEATTEGTFSYMAGVYLFCCRDCGEEGCDSVVTYVTEAEDRVIWSRFEHEGSSRNYDLRYVFDRQQYREALDKLKTLCEEAEKMKKEPRG